MRSLHRLRGVVGIVLGSLAISLAAGCHDSTGVSGSTAHAMVGTYDLTTSLKTFQYVVTSGLTGYTFATVAAGPAVLSGTITIADSVLATKTDSVRLPIFTAVMQETPCSAAPILCESAAPARVVAYDNRYVPIVVTGDSQGVVMVLGSSYELISLSGRFATDSIVGTVKWWTKLGPANQFYLGTYVARRRP